MQPKLQTQLELEGTYICKSLQNRVTAPLREVGGSAECMRFCGDAGDIFCFPLPAFPNILPPARALCKRSPGRGIDLPHRAVWTWKNLSAHPLAERLSNLQGGWTWYRSLHIQTLGRHRTCRVDLRRHFRLGVHDQASLVWGNHG